MPRIRTIKPELPSDKKLARVSRDARYTFVLLITQADDLGFVAASHRKLLGDLFPHDETLTIAGLLAWIEELVNIGRIRWRETEDGMPVLELVNWKKHQRIDNAGKSRLAETLKPFAKPRRSSPRNAAVRGLDLGPRTIGPRTKDLGSRTDARIKTRASPPDQNAAFAEAWAVYPRRSGSNPKTRAQRAWTARIAEGVSTADLLAGVRRYAVHCEAEHKIGTQFVLQAATFFGPDNRWAESWEVSSNGADPAAEEEAALRSTAELIARRRRERGEVAP